MVGNSWIATHAAASPVRLSAGCLSRPRTAYLQQPIQSNLFLLRPHLWMPFLMPEESGNGKFRRKRTAIYYLKRFVGSFALQMYLFRYMFFASSVVAQYHNSHVAFGKQFCHFVYTAKLLTFAVNNLVIQLDESFLLVYDFFQTFINYIKQQFLRYIVFRSQFHSPSRHSCFHRKMSW